MRENVLRSPVHAVWPAASIAHHLAKQGPPSVTAEDLGTRLRELVRLGLDDLPMPGDGQTMERWRALAEVAVHDLRLAKLYEGHTDALAILAELRGPAPLAHTTWGVWAAEPPTAKVTAVREADGRARLTGRKGWCWGATVLTHALVKAWIEPDQQCLVAVPLAQDSIRIHAEPWQAVGMGTSGSVEVEFRDTWGSFIGGPGEYVNRPGFWHGATGMAACWFGAATAIGEALREHVAARSEPQAAAHLGAVDVALGCAAAMLREAAMRIDAAPDANIAALALRVRETVEGAASNVVQHVGRALGTGPLCRDARVARHMADLPIFLRERHADRDLTHLGVAVANLATGSWAL
jgi:hypothetical protein